MTDPLTITDATIRWDDTFDNDPSLVVYVNREPRYERWRKNAADADQLSEEQLAIVRPQPRKVPARSGWHVYTSQDGPLVSMFTWGGKPDDGFGGRRRTITLEDGTDEEIVGGWHPSGATGLYAGLDLMSVAYHHDGWKPHRDGDKWSGLGFAAFGLKDQLLAAVDEFLPDVETLPGYDGKLTTFKLKGQVSKAEWRAQERARQDVWIAERYEEWGGDLMPSLDRYAPGHPARQNKRHAVYDEAKRRGVEWPQIRPYSTLGGQPPTAHGTLTTL